MKGYHKFLVWLLSTVLFSYAMFTAYSNNHKREMAAIYICFISVQDRTGVVVVNERSEKTGEELSKIELGSRIYRELTVSDVTESSNSYYVKFQHPNVSHAEMKCFKRTIQ